MARPNPGHGPEQAPEGHRRPASGRLRRAVAAVQALPHPPAPARTRHPAPPDFIATADNLKALLQMPWTESARVAGGAQVRDHAPAGRRQRKTGERRVRVPRGTRALPTLDARRAPGERPRRRTRIHLPGPLGTPPPGPRRPPPGFPADYSRLRRPSIDRWDGLDGRSPGRKRSDARGPVGSYAAAGQNAHRSFAAGREPADPRRVASRARGEAAVPLPLRRGWAGAPGHPGGCRGCRGCRRLGRADEDETRTSVGCVAPARGDSPPAAAAQVDRSDGRASAAGSRARRRRRDGVLAAPAPLAAENACGDEDGGGDRRAGEPRAIRLGRLSLAIGAFGKPHLFEWEVHGHRLLVESSLAVFRREGARR